MTPNLIKKWATDSGMHWSEALVMERQLVALAHIVRNHTLDELSRENAALEKRLQEIQRMCLGYQEEHAGLRKDAERLDFIEANAEGRLLRKYKKRWSFEPVCSNYEYPVFPKLREAIDAAMKEQT